MTCTETAVQIPCARQDMLGILSLPPAGMPAPRTAVLIVVGGAQYRVGSHRQFALLARRLAAAGIPVLRFDMQGMGDTPGPASDFEDCSTHIAAAIDALPGLAPGVRQVALWGLCDGASASLLYIEATQDPRVAGLCLLNPWVRSEASLARTHVKHYYRQRLLDPAFWRKLIGGGVGWKALAGLTASLRQAFTASAGDRPKQPSFQVRMAQGWQKFPGSILVLLSEQDLTAKEFVETASSDRHWANWKHKPRSAILSIPGADHTCSSTAAMDMLITSTTRFVQSVEHA